MASLKDRLRAMRAETEKNSRTPRAPEAGKARPPEARGWETAGDFVFRRTCVFRLPAAALNELSAAADFFLGAAGVSGLIWYDTETTGLSGGAGTHIFLYGSARVNESGICLTQLFLADFPGEKAFLSAVEADFAASPCAPVMLSYNGRAFDAPLLRGRFILNRIPRELPPQFDLLFTSRRLWKNILPDCRLATVEKYILGKEREGDIPGGDIPQAYFDYLAGRRTGIMQNVVSHHREDILSLVYLFARFGRIVEHPENELRAEGINAAALGDMLEARRPGKGLPVLRAAALGGDTRALALLSRHYKRAGAFAEALGLWTSLAEKNAFAALELAKHREHRDRDYKEALRLTERLLAEAGKAADRAALEKRRKRLLRKTFE